MPSLGRPDGSILSPGRLLLSAEPSFPFSFPLSLFIEEEEERSSIRDLQGSAGISDRAGISDGPKKDPRMVAS